MLRLNFCMIGCPINFIVRSLINWIALYMYSQIEYYFKSHLKIVSNSLHENNKYWTYMT